MKNGDEAMKVAIIFYVKNKIEIDVIRRLIIKFQSFSDEWPTSEFLPGTSVNAQWKN